MDARLKDQVAIVTGAADGIGRAIAQLFCAHGAKVIVADINAELGASAAQELMAEGYAAHFVHTDIASVESVEAMVAECLSVFSAPSVLVNNAALIRTGKDPLSIDQAKWRENFAVNVDGMWNCCRAVIPHMQALGQGSIVNVGSVHSFKIVPGYFPYAVTKHAVIGLTRNLAVEYGPANIRVNALCPGMVETPMAFKAWAETSDPAAAREAIAKVHPLGRNSTTQEMAYPALFLACHESNFMTGQALVVDGGRSAIYHD